MLVTFTLVVELLTQASLPPADEGNKLRNFHPFRKMQPSTRDLCNFDNEKRKVNNCSHIFENHHHQFAISLQC